MDKESKTLDIKEFATRGKKEVWEELEMMLAIMPINKEGKQLLTMIFAEFYHWMFTDPSMKHPKPSDILTNVLYMGAPRKTTQRYDA